MNNTTDKRQLRSFGFIVGGIFSLIALWPALVYRADPRWWALLAAAILLIPAAVYPSALRRPHQASTDASGNPCRFGTTSFDVKMRTVGRRNDVRPGLAPANRR